MIEITVEKDHFVFEVKGMHKLWAFKNQLSIPKANILSAHQDFSDIGTWKGLRMPGTHVPYLITAGTFYTDNKKIFWDVVNQEKSIVVELKDEDYQQLIIEVADPAEAIALLKQAQ